MLETLKSFFGSKHDENIRLSREKMKSRCIYTPVIGGDALIAGGQLNEISGPAESLFDQYHDCGVPGESLLNNEPNCLVSENHF